MIIPLIFLIAGVVIGRFFPDLIPLQYIDPAITVSLFVVVFCAGIDAGSRKSALQKLRKMGAKVLLVPGGVVIGSLLGGMLAGIILQMPFYESTAVAAGFGYYSMSTAIFNGFGAYHLGALAFLSNVLREFLSLLCIPLTARLFGKLTAVAPGGATTMDVTLPVIARCTNEEITIIAMINGIILSILVPVLVPVLYQYLPF